MIVVGSDGLWDNLHHNELGLHVNQYWSNPKHLASSIANACFSYSLNSSYRSPFYEKAQRVGLSYPCTGKSDDITVVVARVVFDYL
jgi:serine/threonine protein phosphatase PrpC